MTVKEVKEQMHMRKKLEQEFKREADAIAKLQDENTLMTSKKIRSLTI